MGKWQPDAALNTMVEDDFPIVPEPGISFVIYNMDRWAQCQHNATNHIKH